MRSIIVSAIATCLMAAPAFAECSMTNDGKTVCLTTTADGTKKISKRHSKRAPSKNVVVDASGNNVVRSSTGITVRVAPAARASLQCVVDHVERAGVRIASMRGYGRGSVSASVHPIGYALDINQTARNRTNPHVPPAVSNAAGEACGVISGATWGDRDNGHWNLSRSAIHARDNIGHVTLGDRSVAGDGWNARIAGSDFRRSVELVR